MNEKNPMNRDICAYVDGIICGHEIKDAGEISEDYCNNCQEFISKNMKHLILRVENKPGIHPRNLMRIEGFKSRAEIKNFAIMVGAIIQGVNESEGK